MSDPTAEGMAEGRIVRNAIGGERLWWWDCDICDQGGVPVAWMELAAQRLVRHKRTRKHLAALDAARKGER